MNPTQCESMELRPNEVSALTIRGVCVGTAIRLDGGSWAYDTGAGALLATDLLAIADELDRLNGETNDT